MYSNYIPKQPKHTNGITMYSERGQNAGSVVGDEWRKNIVTAWMLNKPPALAVDVATLKAAITVGAAWLVITNTETRITYRASIEKFLAKGWEFNRGYGLQRGMVLSAWQQTKDGEVIHEPPTYPPTAPDVTELKYKSRAVKGAIFNGKQLSLFEVK